MKRTRLIFSALVVLLVAAFAAAQNADKNSAGPTKNDYRLRIVQPVEGARITGDTVQVVIDRTIPAERDVKTDVNSMPRPLIDVFLDEKFQSSMPGDTNVADLQSVTPGPHTITILAKTMSGEVIDRKVIGFVAVAPPAPRPAVAEKPRPVAPPPAPAPVYAPPPAEPPAPAAAQEMPKTGTSDPLLLVAGLGLLLGGIAVRRLC
jgi:LPXTG-motif cell wall-anchored protein